ncbi:SCO4225 family membrane protein [Actinomadura atramentaria]|uniref:SCO4225 family membrane protein n=1 Tax=Actinomadura atramentaria TaxID=1990 RepID=UPI0012FB6096|nr:hypothetical protein [Actinomadura atramentaria]
MSRLFAAFAFAERSPFDRVRLVVAVAYAALVLAVALMVLAVETFSADPGFVGVWLVFVTSPTSLLIMPALALFDDLPIVFGQIAFYVVALSAGTFHTWLVWPRRRVFPELG